MKNTNDKSNNNVSQDTKRGSLLWWHFQWILFAHPYMKIASICILLLKDYKSASWGSLFIGSCNGLLLLLCFFKLLGNHYMKIYNISFNFVALWLIAPWFHDRYYCMMALLMTIVLPFVLYLPIIVGIPHMAEILPNKKLFLGNAKSAVTKSLLQENNVTHVLEICDDEQHGNDNKLVAANVKKVFASDHLNSENHLYNIAEDGVRYIHENMTAKDDDGAVLVHCSAGVSRSPAMIILYLLTYHPEDFDSIAKAYQYVRNKRPMIDISIDHMRSIEKYYQELKDKKKEK